MSQGLLCDSHVRTSVVVNENYASGCSMFLLCYVYPVLHCEVLVNVIIHYRDILSVTVN